MTIRALVTGAAGQLGRELVNSVPEKVVCTGLGHCDLDISCVDSVSAAIEKVRPHVIINAAGYTAVDRAESEPDKALRVNAEGAANLARQCEAASIKLIHISTDYVFDGRASVAYSPDAGTHPLGEYGRSKLAGERAVVEACPGATIFRSGWIYSCYANNFVKTMLQLMRTRESLTVVSDQTGTPTWARGLASLCWKACAEGVSNPEFAGGIYHWSDSGQCSWFEFAQAICAEAMKIDLLNKAVILEPISTADYAAVAPRPAFSVMDTTLTEERFNIASTAWRQQLSSMLTELKASTHG